MTSENEFRKMDLLSGNPPTMSYPEFTNSVQFQPPFFQALLQFGAVSHIRTSEEPWDIFTVPSMPACCNQQK